MNDTDPCQGALPSRSRLPLPLQVVLAVVLLALSISLPQLITLIPAVRQPIEDDPTGPAAITLSLVILLLPTLVALSLVQLVLRIDGRRRLSMIGWRWQRRAPTTLLAGIAVSLVAMLGPALLLSFTGLLRPVDQLQLDRWDATPLWLVLLSLLLTGFTVQAIPEELIFRGYLLRSLRTGRISAIVISSAVFAVLHLVSGGGQQGVLERILYLAMPLGFGFCAAVLSLRWDSLWAAIGVHGGLHIAYPIVYVLGLGDGPWLWCSAGVLWTAIGMLAWRVPQRSNRDRSAR